LSLRRAKERVFTDERILGRGDFVEAILREAAERLKHQFGRSKGQKEVATLVEQMCEEGQINVKELRMGSRRGRISEVRSEIACQLGEKYGLPLAEIARHLGVSTSAISKAITKKMR
jgi:putative transposase